MDLLTLYPLSFLNVFSIGRGSLIRLYTTMLRTRLVDLTLLRLHEKGEVRKRLFNGFGQEAGAVAITALLKEEDYLIPSYRGFAHVIGRGVTPKEVFSEMLSKRTGALFGQGNPGTFTDQARRIYPNSDFLGSNFPVAVGMGLAAKKKGAGETVIIFFGDGASTRSVLFGSLNLSVIWNLPILWVCENNGYSLSTRYDAVSRTSVAEKARGFGIRSFSLDGNDALGIWRCAKRLIADMRKYPTPVFLELNTFRLTGFEATDSDWYRDREEISRWKRKDPLPRLEAAVRLFVSLAEINEIKHNVQREVEEAAFGARRAPELTEQEVVRLFETYG